MNAISDQIGLDLLRVYVAVCRQGSLNRVAELSRRSQSAVSTQIRKLEQLLDSCLLLRNGRGVVPTEQGEIVLAYAQRILALTDEAALKLREHDSGRVVRIGVADEWFNEHIASAFTKVREKFGGVSVELTIDQSLRLGERWTEGSLDVMVTATSAVRSDATNTWNIRLEWVCAPDYRVPDAGAIDLVILAPPCKWRQNMLDSISAMGRSYRIAFTSEASRALAEAVKCGFGVGLLPSQLLPGSGLKKLGKGEGFPPGPIVQYGVFVRDQRDILSAEISALLNHPNVIPNDKDL